MTVQYGYFYDKDGKFTHIDALENKAVYKKVMVEQYVPELKITEEKLCEIHTAVEDGTYETVEGEEVPPKYLCPNCIMRSEETVYVNKPVETDEFVGYEPIVPANCTLEVCPDLIFEPVFKDGKWVKTKDYTPPTEPTVPVKSEVQELKEQVANLMKVVDELLIGGAM